MLFGAINFQDELTIKVTAAKTIYVPGNYSSIQAAIDNATSSDTIHVWAGTYYENVVVDKTVSIIGNGSEDTIIDGGKTGSGFTVTADWVNITGFRLMNSRGGIPPDVGAGILLDEVENVTINNNNCSNNAIGIFVKNSKSNFIINNICNLNNWFGIASFSSNTNEIKNNMCDYNQYYGIESFESHSNRITNNTCIFNEYGIVLKDSKLDLVSNNKCNSNLYNGILAYNSDYSTMTNNICLGNDLAGILSYGSKSNTITNNLCNSTWYYGIAIRYSSSNTLLNNKLLSCSLFMQGDKLEHWNTHTIDIKNTVNNKPIYYWKNCTGGTMPTGGGQIILAYCTNVHIEKQSFYKCNTTVMIGYSSYNYLNENLFIQNDFGPFFYCSPNNFISNNTFISNYEYGLFLDLSSENNIFNNTFSSNYWFNLALRLSKNNQIFNNNISVSKYCGLFLNSSHSNTISNNDILFNKDIGLGIKNSNQNKIYHNNFITTSNQTYFIGDCENNLWDNGNGEGNYWSDYKGLDNGANDRKANDGIGDTEIPHLDLDHYPLVNKSGWLYPGIPRLFDPGEITTDGYYSLIWHANRGTSYFVLEEDTNSEFNSPTIVYSGSLLYYQIQNKPNGTYYYRLKAFSEKYESPWSNIVDIIVDWPPEIPKNLKVISLPIGNVLNLSWDLNHIDTKVYELYYKTQLMPNWELLGSISHPNKKYSHIGLQDGLEYSYKLRALDARDHESEFSEIVSGIPADITPPLPPHGLKIKSITYNSISLVWEGNSEDDLEGYNVYRYSIADPLDWGDNIGTVNTGNESYIDTGLKELNLYYYVITAFDEVPNESNFSAVVSGSTLQREYGPEINNSVPDFSINEDCVDCSTINLYNWFFDPNSDPLIFWCSGQNYINVTIFQENGTVILRPAKNWHGKEKLFFYASNGKFSCSDYVRITIIPMNDPPDQPRILSPTSETTIGFGFSLNFVGECNDSDLPDDELTFKWSSNLQGELGFGEQMTGILLISGVHQITLTVYDSAGNNSSAEIKLLVLENPKPVKESDDNNNLWVGALIGLIIIIVILLLSFFFVKKRGEKLDESSATEPAASRFSFLSLRVTESTDKKQSGSLKDKKSTTIDELKNKPN